ncbi:MAG: NADH-quinone oxidoreductase subunit J [Pelagibacterales bacterium]|nr:NADH-quinone oxidoreductase subunit J [Pelagibacterales bacterium]|tara:strand:+ start:1576 stop:2178 length:603 start_codon:yes stop_codon:yes gene_type:complete
MSIELIIFFVFSSLLIISAIGVVTVNNPVKSAIYLVFAFFTSAVLWLLLNAEFLAIILILVYVGAVMVLFLFVVMMLDINISELKEGFVNYFPVGAIVFLITTALLISFFQTQFVDVDKNIINEIKIIGDDNTKNLGYLLYTEYILAFEISAIILLLGIVSAITLTHQKNPANKYQIPSEQVNVKKEDRIKIIKDKEGDL